MEFDQSDDGNSVMIVRKSCFDDATSFMESNNTTIMFRHDEVNNITINCKDLIPQDQNISLLSAIQNADKLYKLKKLMDAPVQAESVKVFELKLQNLLKELKPTQTFVNQSPASTRRISENKSRNYNKMSTSKHQTLRESNDKSINNAFELDNKFRSL